MLLLFPSSVLCIILCFCYFLLLCYVLSYAFVILFFCAMYYLMLLLFSWSVLCIILCFCYFLLLCHVLSYAFIFPLFCAIASKGTTCLPLSDWNGIWNTHVLKVHYNIEPQLKKVIGDHCVWSAEYIVYQDCNYRVKFCRGAARRGLNLSNKLRGRLSSHVHDNHNLSILLPLGHYFLPIFSRYRRERR